MNQDDRRGVLDMAAMIGVAVLLLGMGFCHLFAFSISKNLAHAFHDMENAELPMLSKYVLKILQSPVYSAVPALLILAGFWALFVTKDRLRGMVYGLIFALLVAVLGVLSFFASIVPFIKVIQMVG